MLILEEKNQIKHSLLFECQTNVHKSVYIIAGTREERLKKGSPRLQHSGVEERRVGEHTYIQPCLLLLLLLLPDPEPQEKDALSALCAVLR